MLTLRNWYGLLGRHDNTPLNAQPSKELPMLHIREGGVAREQDALRLIADSPVRSKQFDEAIWIAQLAECPSLY